MRTRSVITRTAAGGLAAGLALALSSCDFPGGGSKSVDAAAAASASASPSEGDWAELADIDPGLAADQEKAIAAADTVCEALKAGEDADEVARTAGAEFTDDQIKPGPGDVSRIIEVLKSTTCG
ncbi:hypothetical protein [Kitasatospora phosalacinea]|uniref:hypothetical protein n=1 Tax=Kitasatospora phosalacinea TaxID=2065 RepID=UPI0012FF0528|nr:hypothetical protein [Kitasatospora phosalacinea]